MLSPNIAARLAKYEAGHMEVHDVIGVGFGPSNIGLAIALKEDFAAENIGKSFVFLDSKPKHSWHHPMMLPNAKMQISFMKDLCFLRNPSSNYTFVNYLHQQKRLARFANMRDFNPSRKEFDDYLRWVAEQFNDITRYASSVDTVHPVEKNGQITHLDVRVRHTGTHEVTTLRTRNLALAIGGQPSLPVDLKHSDVFHSSEFLQRINDYDQARPWRFLVVGAGQSAAEIYNYLINQFPQSDAHVVSSGIGFKQADDSVYVNEIFDHGMVNHFFELNEIEREKMLTKHYDTNYSVADLELIQQIYRQEYEASITGGQQRFGILKFSRLISLVQARSGIQAKLRSSLGSREYIHEADVIIFATGYHRLHNHTLLKQLAPYLASNDSKLKLSRNYALSTRDNFLPKIYIQGVSEATHGLSDTLLSVISHRAYEIAKDIVSQNETYSLNGSLCCES